MKTQNKQAKSRYKSLFVNDDRRCVTYNGLSVNAKINAKYHALSLYGMNGANLIIRPELNINRALFEAI